MVGMQAQKVYEKYVNLHSPICSAWSVWSGQSKDNVLISWKYNNNISITDNGQVYPLSTHLCSS